MMRLLRDSRRALVLALCITACKAEGETRPAPERAAPPKAHEPKVTPAPEAEPAPAPVAETEPAPVAEAAPKAEPAPKAEQDLVETETWPLVRWDHAKAYVFNLERGPGLSLYAYNESKGWNTRIDSEHEITQQQAETAVSLAETTLGTMLVSKCPMPRHAVVLFAGETPVASINVCFECGDILVWPEWERDPSWPERKQEMHAKLLKAYDRTFPKWEAFFGKTLGLDLAPAKAPGG